MKHINTGEEHLKDQEASGLDEEDITDLYDVLKKLKDEVESIRKQLYFLNMNMEDVVLVMQGKEPKSK